MQSSSQSPPRIALSFHLPSYRCVAVRIHCTSCLGTAKPSLFHPPLVHSFPCQSQRVLSLSILIPATRFLSLSPLVLAFPSHCVSQFLYSAASPVLPAVPYLRMWATLLVSGDLLPLEAALATVAPLEQTAQCAVVQPFSHGLRVLGVHHEDAELKHGTGWDGLGCGQRHALAGGGAGAKRALAATALGTLGGAGTGFCAAPRTRCRR